LVVLLETPDEGVCVVGGVVVDDVGWVVRVDLVDVLSELAAWLGLDLLDLLEAARLHEGALSLEVGGEHLRELGADVGEDVVGGQLEEGLKGGQVSAHLDDVLEGLLGLILEVLRTFWEHVDGQESRGHIGLGQELRMVGGVTTDLTEGPGGCGLEVVLWLVDQGVLEGSDALRHDNGHGERVVEGRDVAEGHDAGQSRVTLGLTNVVHDGCSTA
jgi:hypothetical protein